MVVGAIAEALAGDLCETDGMGWNGMGCIRRAVRTYVCACVCVFSVYLFGSLSYILGLGREVET